MATNLNSHFKKAIENTSHAVLIPFTDAAVRRFYNAAIRKYTHYDPAIRNICDGLWEIFETTIEKYIQNTTNGLMDLRNIMSNLRKWIESHVLSISVDADDYNGVMDYLNASVTDLITEFQQSLKTTYSDIYEHVESLRRDQLRSFFVADLVIPAVRDIDGYVNEYNLVCYGKKAMEWTVLNVLEAICDGSMQIDSLDRNTKMEIAYTWGIISRSHHYITTKQDDIICQALHQLFQSYTNIAEKYDLQMDKLIDLIREKQLRNEFVHYRDAIRNHYNDYLKEFLTLEDNRLLKDALQVYDETEKLSTMFENCWKFLQLPKENRQVFYFQLK
jgi:hypothetical protein